MYFFYVDESGSPEGHHEPLRNGETPIFTLNAIALHKERWRLFGARFLALKQRYYRTEVGTGRPLYHEVKGSSLVAPRNRGSRRNLAFLKDVLRLCDEQNVRAFSIIFLKDNVNPTGKASLYTMALQYLVERFQSFLEEKDEHPHGLIIVDSRVHNLDLNVAKSHQSFVFGNEIGRACDRILEAPLFVDSKLTVGVQVADIVGALVYATYYARNCMFVPGALDYSHVASSWPRLDALQFVSQHLYDGYTRRGFRLIDFRHRSVDRTP
jgi:hypothetical protein